MKLLLRLFFVLVLVFTPSSPTYAKKTQAQREFLAAKKALEEFSKSKKVKYRRYWLRIINRFRRIYLRYPESPEAPKALIWTARLYRNLYGYSQKKSDLKEALRRYRMLWEHYPESNLADDALFEAAQVYEKLLGDHKKAKELKELILKKYPKSDTARKLKRSGFVAKAYSTKSRASSKRRNKVVGNRKYALVKEIRHWSGEDYSRVVVELDSRVEFEDHVLKASKGKPPRVYVDLKPARLSRYVPTELPVRDGLLTRVRLGQYKPKTVRVVLDLKSLTSYKVFYLGDPPRVVVDLIGEESREIKIKPPPAGKYSLAQQLGLKIRTIMIDPGHGGRDPGAIGLYGLKEKHITLKIAKYLARELRKKGFKVYLTRDSDVFIPLIKRPAMANLKKADLFVSIHVNASPNKRLRGIETYYLSFTTDPEAMRVAALENAVSNQSLSDLQKLLKKLLQNTKIGESKRLAGKVQKELVRTLSRRWNKVVDLGVKKAPFVVLIGTRMPAVLVEVSFITNPVDARRLKSEAYLKDIAKGIAKGIESYAREIQVTAR